MRDNQHLDGGWTAGKGLTVSELFSCLYAIELLMLNKNNQIIRDQFDTALKDATNWIVEGQENN